MTSSAWKHAAATLAKGGGIGLARRCEDKKADYGRSRGIAWYYMGGFGIVQTAPAQGRIVRWDSAA